MVNVVHTEYGEVIIDFNVAKGDNNLVSLLYQLLKPCDEPRSIIFQKPLRRTVFSKRFSKALELIGYTSGIKSLYKNKEVKFLGNSTYEYIYKIPKVNKIVKVKLVVQKINNDVDFCVTEVVAIPM